MAQKKRTTPARASNKPKSTAAKKSGRSTGASKAKAKTRPAATRSRADQMQPDTLFRRQAATVILFACGILFICLSLIHGDNFWLTAHQYLYGIFGLPCVLWGIGLLVFSFFLSQDSKSGSRSKKVLWLLSLLLLINACLTVFSIENADMGTVGEMLADCRQKGVEYHGGGIIGGITAGIAARYIGKVGAIVVWFILVFLFIMVTTKTTVPQLVTLLSKPVKGAKNKADELRDRVSEERARRSAEREQYYAYDDDDGEYDDVAADTAEEPSGRYRTVREKRSNRDFDVAIDDEAPAQRKKKRKSVASTSEFVADERDKKLEDDFNKMLGIIAGGDDEKPAEPARHQRNTPFTPAPENKLPEIKTPDEIADSQLEALVKKKGAPSAQREEKPAMSKSELEQVTDEVTQEIDEAMQSAEEKPAFVFPPIDLLSLPEKIDTDVTDELRENAKRLINTLDEYGVKATVADISRGPTVTRYEIVPAPGVKISRITTLSNDIALRLAAQSVRIEAPIPGKAAVGIEIPNAERKTVSIRELIDCESYKNAKGSLVAVVGRDIEGNLVNCDLAKMPHLLIAGSTGSGKSVCVNSMLISLMYKYTPDELRMVLVDPKKVEFEVYNGIPHLLVPVVCNPKKAAGVLQWAVGEMQKRYEMLQSKNVRSLAAYNKLAEESGEFEKLSKIVIVIDEMADLMQTSPKEVEDAIARLAAMARAAGMHMVLATQRPTVDVITGTIKNNIPSRIALTVSSPIDSRTIINTSGAETLVGYGDMLYMPMGLSKPKRVQGCYISDSEVESVIKFLKRNGNAEYDSSITEEIERKAAENEKSKAEKAADEGGGFVNEDPTMAKAIEAVIQAGQASVSLLQRKLGVGYARAGKLIDQLEERGIVGPYEGSKPRTVLMTKTQWLEMTMSTGENSEAATGIPAEPNFISGASEELPFDIDDNTEE